MSLSVVIITLNASAHIKQCLESVKWADEIIVLDSGSTDATLEICKAYTSRVHTTDWPGFGRQKNRAIDYATKEWVLSLDADESLTPALQTEIQTVMQAQTHITAYQIKRLSTFMGKRIEYGDWGRDWVVRLFKQGSARFSEALVHESLTTNGPVGTLHATMDHDTVTSIEAALQKMNDYSTLCTQQMKAKGRKASFATACLHGTWSFCRCYFIKRGFLDGKAGVLVALLTAQGSFYKYIKLMYATAPSPFKNSASADESCRPT